MIPQTLYLIDPPQIPDFEITIEIGDTSEDDAQENDTQSLNGENATGNTAENATNGNNGNNSENGEATTNENGASPNNEEDAELTYDYAW